jgi:hypothetical protein
MAYASSDICIPKAKTRLQLEGASAIKAVDKPGALERGIYTHIEALFTVAFENTCRNRTQWNIFINCTSQYEDNQKYGEGIFTMILNVTACGSGLRNHLSDDNYF